MTRIQLTCLAILITFALGELSIPSPADAQQAESVRRIGVIGFSSAANLSRSFKVFREELRKYGWVEGQNITIIYRYADGKVAQLPALVTELARLKLDLIVTVTTTATQSAMEVIKTTPIVFTVVADPVASGFVTSLAQPGRNATGPSAMAPQLAGKRLEFLKEVVPGLSRVAVLWEPTNPGVALIFKQVQRDAQSLGLTLQPLEVRSRDDFEPVFAAITREPPDALVVIAAPLTVTYDVDIAAFALKRRLPTIAAWPRFPRKGGLMSYGANFVDNYRRAVPYVDKILRGAKPSDLPVEQPRKYELVINLKTAEALGLTVSPTLRLLANEVIR